MKFFYYSGLKWVEVGWGWHIGIYPQKNRVVTTFGLMGRRMKENDEGKQLRDEKFNNWL